MKKIIKFGKPGCPPCENVDAFLKQKRVEFVSVNPFETTDETYMDLILEHSIKTIPVTLLVDAENNVLARKNGFNPKALEHLIGEFNEQ